MADEVASTLRQLLTQRKPEILCKTTATRNTASGKWPTINSEHVTIWNEFRLDILNASYSHVLDYPLSGPLDGVPQLTETFSGLEVEKDSDINHLFGWNGAMTKATVDFARSQLQLGSGYAIREKHATPTEPRSAQLPRMGKTTPQFDHVIFLDSSPVQNFVVGLGRTSLKWPGSEITMGIQQGRSAIKERFWPVKQLEAVCKLAQTRYGYIQTEQELVVCRFTKNTDEQFKWLCMLAILSPSSSAIVSQEEIVEIDKWDVSGGAVGLWADLHQYSNHAIPLAIPYAGPSSQAQVGFGNVNPADLTAIANSTNVAAIVDPQGAQGTKNDELDRYIDMLNDGPSHLQQ